MTGNLAASILARLLTLAKQRGDDYSLLLNRFGMERLLARVSTSPHADRFLLKGALLFALWYDTPHRPTRDADLLGFGPDDAANLIATFREIAALDLGDGIVFDPDSVKASAIREDNTYGGTRITLVGRIGSARCALQVDVGFGDAVIAQRTELDGATLSAAIAATFARRQTALPTERPLALTRAFSEDAAKQRQWQAFLTKNRIAAASLADTVALLEALLWPATAVAETQSPATATWRPEALRWV